MPSIRRLAQLDKPGPVACRRELSPATGSCRRAPGFGMGRFAFSASNYGAGPPSGAESAALQALSLRIVYALDGFSTFASGTPVTLSNKDGTRSLSPEP
jgi:hypothetical protein